MPRNKTILCLTVLLFISISGFSQQYKNFRVSVYSRAYETQKMADTTGYLKSIWDELTRQLKVDKIYLETHRDLLIVDQKTLDIAKKFFKDRGVETAGGITYTISEPNRFETFCYSDPNDRKKVKEIAEYTARNFNEVILDDFFFTNCKDDGEIKAKGTRSWTKYRLDLMTEASKSLVINPAKAVNPKVKVVIKYPNWYEHFQGLGFNLETEPSLYDGIYTGTETRDAVRSAQHLQPYLGYNIFRYFSNIKPGGNGGGWVDPFGMGNFDRYAEQLWITAFAKAPEITLFDLRSLVRTIQPTIDRAPWQGQNTSFDFDQMMQPVNYNGGKAEVPTTIARAAGYAFETVDKFLGQLGKPIGIKSYRPYHATGEDFLQNYLGMIGLPMDQRPVFPTDDSVILLTEEAKSDADIVKKIKRQLTQGKSVIITSGLLRALQDKGIEDIAEIRYTDRKAIVKDYTVGWTMVQGQEPVLIPQISYLTNDSWEMASGIDGPNGWPILHEADYSKGKFYVLTIPDNFAELYNLPSEVLNVIRKAAGGQLKVRIEGPANISLYVYDNNTCIVESFLPQETELKIVTGKPYTKLTDLQTNESITGTIREPQLSWREPKDNGSNAFSIKLKPHSFRVFRFE